MLYIYNMRLIFAALIPTMLVIAERVPVRCSKLLRANFLPEHIAERPPFRSIVGTPPG